MLTTTLEMTYHVSVRGPLPEVTSVLGARQYWEITAARLEGPRIDAKLAMRGGDWRR
jgi:hypothetical protein